LKNPLQGRLPKRNWVGEQSMITNIKEGNRIKIVDGKVVTQGFLDAEKNRQALQLPTQDQLNARAHAAFYRRKAETEKEQRRMRAERNRARSNNAFA